LKLNYISASGHHWMQLHSISETYSRIFQRSLWIAPTP